MKPFDVRRLLVCVLVLFKPITASCQPAPASEQRLHNLLHSIAYKIYNDTANTGKVIRQVLAESQSNSSAKAVAYVMQGVHKQMRGEHKNALHLFRLAEGILLLPKYKKDTNILVQIGQINKLSGTSELYLGNTQTSIIKYLRAVDYYEMAHHYDNELLVYHDLSSLFVSVGQTDKAEEYLRRALSLENKPLSQPQYLITIYLLLATLRIEQSRFAEAWKYLSKANHLLSLPLSLPHKAKYEYTLGIYFFETGKYKLAGVHFRQALNLTKHNGDARPIYDIYLALGRTAKICGNKEAAHTYFVKSLALAKAFRNPNQEAQAIEWLADLEETRGSSYLPTALYYLKQLRIVQARLEEGKTTRAILALEAKHHTREQQQQIQILNTQQQLQQQLLRRRTLLSYATLAIAGLLACALVLGYRVTRVRRQLATKDILLKASRISELEQERQLVATEAMLRGQDEERSRIARDLHDGLGGMLTATKHYLNAACSSAALPASSEHLLANSLAQLDTSIVELRRVANDMMPEALQQFGLAPALQDLCASLSHSQQLQVYFQAYELPAQLPQQMEVILYRLVQELLNNAMKHAAAKTVLVQVMRNYNTLQLLVEDDGRGFTPDNSRSGVGLRSIQSRVDYLRGTLHWHSHPGQGTTATIDFPIADV